MLLLYSPKRLSVNTLDLFLSLYSFSKVCVRWKTDHTQIILTQSSYNIHWRGHKKGLWGWELYSMTSKLLTCFHQWQAFPSGDRILRREILRKVCQLVLDGDEITILLSGILVSAESCEAVLQPGNIYRMHDSCGKVCRSLPQRGGSLLPTEHIPENV